MLDDLDHLIDRLKLDGYDTAKREGDEVHVTSGRHRFVITNDAESEHYSVIDSADPDSMTRSCEDADAVLRDLRDW
jgi:hypothetical protein